MMHCELRLSILLLQLQNKSEEKFFVKNGICFFRVLHAFVLLIEKIQAPPITILIILCLNFKIQIYTVCNSERHRPYVNFTLSMVQVYLKAYFI